MVLKYWMMMIPYVRSIFWKCSVMIFSRIDRFVSLLLVASLLLCCVPALGVQVQAVDSDMYLYNGLEALSIYGLWDVDTYPYAVIGLRSSTPCVVFLSSPMYVTDDGDHVVLVDSLSSFYMYSSVPSWYRNVTGTEEAYVSFFPYTLIWSNHDIFSLDGSLVLAASAPIPVGGAVPDPTDPPSSVSSVGITGAQQITKGTSSSYTVSIVGLGDFDSSVNVTVSGNTSSATTIEKVSSSGLQSEYLLFCSPSETSDLLTVTATSVQNPSVGDSINVAVLESAVDPSIPSDPTVSPDVPPQIQTSFDGQTVYVDLGEEFGLLFWVTGYEDMHLEYYEFGDLVAETDLSYDASSGVLYGGFFVAGETPDSYTEVRIDAYSGGMFIEAFSCTVICADPPSPDGSDQVIMEKIDELGGDITQMQDHVELVDKKVDTILSGGENGPDLSEQGGQISDSVGQIGDYEQSQKDVLDSNMDAIIGQVDFVNFIPALAFVGGYINKAWVSLTPVHLVFIVPLFLGLFFFLCSRVPGATRWKARRPPSDPTKK